jgi:hypothetical protein
MRSYRGFIGGRFAAFLGALSIFLGLFLAFKSTGAPYHCVGSSLLKLGGENGDTFLVQAVVDLASCNTNGCSNLGEGSYKCTDAGYALTFGPMNLTPSSAVCTPQDNYNTNQCAGTYTTSNGALT